MIKQLKFWCSEDEVFNTSVRFDDFEIFNFQVTSDPKNNYILFDYKGGDNWTTSATVNNGVSEEIKGVSNGTYHADNFQVWEDLLNAVKYLKYNLGMPIHMFGIEGLKLYVGLCVNKDSEVVLGSIINSSVVCTTRSSSDLQIEADYITIELGRSVRSAELLNTDIFDLNISIDDPSCVLDLVLVSMEDILLNETIGYFQYVAQQCISLVVPLKDLSEIDCSEEDKKVIEKFYNPSTWLKAWEQSAIHKLSNEFEAFNLKYGLSRERIQISNQIRQYFQVIQLTLLNYVN